jgi:hypothetical protein
MEDKRPLLNRFLNSLKAVAPIAAQSVFPGFRAVSAATGLAEQFPSATRTVQSGLGQAMGAVGGAVTAWDEAGAQGFLAPGAGLALAPGAVQQQAARTGVSPRVVGEVSQTATARLEQTKAKAAEKVGTVEVEPMGPVGPLVNAAYRAEQGFSYAISRPASTFTLLTDPTSPLYQGGRLDVGTVSKPSIEGFQWRDVIDAWNRSADVSYGRATVASPLIANTIGLVGGAGKYNPWSNQSMDEADKNAFYNVLSGSFDFALQTVLPTKGIRPARIALMKKKGLTTTVASADDLVRLRSDYEMHQVNSAARETLDRVKQLTEETASGTFNGKPLLSQQDQVALNLRLQAEGLTPEKIEAAREAALRGTETPIGRSVVELAAETRQAKVRSHPLIANSEGADKDKLASIIARTDDQDTVYEILAANLGDMTALRRLQEAAPDHVWALADMDVAIRNAWMDGAPFMPTGEAARVVKQTFDTALDRDAYFRSVKEMFVSGQGFPTAGSVWMPTRSLLVEEIRKKGRATEYAIKTADWDDAPKWVSQVAKTGYGQPVTVFLQWTSSRQPLGTVSRSGARPNDMYIEFEAMVNSLPFMRGSRSVTVGQDLVDGKITPITVPANDYRAALRQRLVDGNNRNQIQDTWRAIEDELVDAAADTLGIERSIAREFVRGYRMQADGQLDYLAREGFLFDEAGQQIRVSPLTQRQFLDSFTTLPMNDIYLAMQSELSNLQKGLIRGGQIGTAAFDAGLKFWRVNLLFRGGYVTKFGVTEPLIMSLLSHGTILTDEGLMATIGNFSRNRVKNIKRVAYNLDLDRSIKKHVLRQPVQTRKQVEAELKKLVQERHDTERIIDSLVAELDDMRLGRVSPARVARYEDEVKGRLVEAQIRLDGIQDILDGRLPEWRQVIEPANLTNVRASLRKYRAILGDDPNYVNELKTEIADIQARATARGGRMTVNDRSKYEYLVAELEDIQSIDPKTITPDLRERIAALQSSYDDAIQYYRKPLNDPTLKIQELEKNLQRIDSQIQARQIEIGAGRKEIGEVTGERGFEGSGQGYMTLNVGGEQFRVPAAFSDRGYDFGSAYRAEASAAQTSRLTLDPSYRMGETSSQWKRSGMADVIEPTNPIYWDELAYAANRHLRGDKLIQRYFEGSTKAELAVWLRTPEGQAYQKSMGKNYLVPNERYSDPVSPLPNIDGSPSNLSPKNPRVILESTTELDEVIRLVDQYFPDPKVRQMIAAREVTPGDLQKAMGNRDDLSRILTDDLIFTPEGQMSRVMSSINRVLDKIWSWIATNPEDRIGRWPWYQREFRAVMERRANILSGQGIKMTPEAWQAIRQEAHRETLSSLEKTFYNIRRYNNPIYMSRFLFGFPGATFNAFYRYGRMTVREPERMLVGALGFESMLSNYGLDEDGNPVDDIRKVKTILIPGTRRDPMDTGLTVPVESFLTVAFDWPAASYASAITLAQVNRMNPKTEEMLQRALGESGFDAMFPYGLPRNPVSGMFGPYQKDLQSAFRGESDGDFTRLAIEFHADDMARWEKEGSEGDMPLFADAVADTRSFLFSRAGWRFGETFSVRRNPPGQMMRDAWFRIRDQYGDTREARAKYMEEYGDWARWYTYSTTDMRAFIPRSYDAYERVWRDDPNLTREIVSLLGDDVSMVSLMTLGASDEFARSVSNFLQDSPLPGDNVPVVRRMTIEKFNNMVLVDDGWTEFTTSKSAYQAERLRLRTLRDEAETDTETNKYRGQIKQLDNAWDDYVVDLESRNLPWAADRSSGFEIKPKRATIVLNKILNGKNFMAKHGKEPIWLKVKDFLKERDVALQGLKDAKNSEHKSQIKAAFAKYVEENYIENDPAFLNLWDRYYVGEWVSE